MKVDFLNADKDDCAKAILAGCYKYGKATLLAWGGSTMTCVIEYEDNYPIQPNA